MKKIGIDFSAFALKAYYTYVIAEEYNAPIKILYYISYKQA